MSIGEIAAEAMANWAREMSIIGAYALFLFVGAFFGWKAGSKISLVMGLVSGALVIVGACIVNYTDQGYLLLMPISGLLTVVFLIRVVKTKKFMPAGMLVVVSGLFFFYCIMQFFNV